jgi:hypothetical protein
MGYNRPGNARKKRLRRAKKHNERLALKAQSAAPAAADGGKK